MKQSIRIAEKHAVLGIAPKKIELVIHFRIDSDGLLPPASIVGRFGNVIESIQVVSRSWQRKIGLEEQLSILVYGRERVSRER